MELLRNHQAVLVWRKGKWGIYQEWGDQLFQVNLECKKGIIIARRRYLNLQVN
jgi:hypothetical protein